MVDRAKLGTGCPLCSGRRVALERSLAVLAPEVAAEWHPTKNEDLLPRQVTLESSRRVWWKCPKGDDHEWQVPVFERASARTARSKCPFCANRRLSKTNALATGFPELAAQWHPTKNGTLGPDDVIFGSHRRAWWRCPAGHVWQTAISQRTRQGTGCPRCAGRLVLPLDSLEAVAPKVAAEWHPTKNGTLTPREVAWSAERPVWWKCPKGDDHEWQTASVRTRVEHPQGCPFCRGRRVSITNALATCFPHIAQEWHPTKNGTLTPKDVAHGTGRRVWWRCEFGHEWRISVGSRTRSCNTCPHCRKIREAMAAQAPRPKKARPPRPSPTTRSCSTR